MTTQREPPTNGQPLSWRDVYRAVEESEGRVLAALTALSTRVLGVQTDHERRLRSVEDGLLIQMGRRQSAVEVLGAGKTFVLLAFSATGAAIAIIDFLRP